MKKLPHHGPQEIVNSILSLSDEIRYVACYQDGKLTSRSRSTLADASAPESDKYEELFVNPAILTLAHQRGSLDCGGTHYVLIRYGNFFQWVRRLNNGHISVCIEPTANLFQCIKGIEKLLKESL